MRRLCVCRKRNALFFICQLHTHIYVIDSKLSICAVHNGCWRNVHNYASFRWSDISFFVRCVCGCIRNQAGCCKLYACTEIVILAQFFAFLFLSFQLFSVALWTWKHSIFSHLCPIISLSAQPLSCPLFGFIFDCVQPEEKNDIFLFFLFTELNR